MPLFEGVILVDDEGADLGTARYINFVGAGVVATVANDIATVTIAGAAAAPGAASQVKGIVDFGFPTGSGLPYSPLEGDTATVTVTASWVAATSSLVCMPAALATANHDVDDAMVENITAYASNIVPGVGFDITAIAPNGSWGQYIINVIGL